ncbi:hypothetical protein PPL_00300 [Heterostelium album PN500]|uniref:CCHC-type domain-containing protein n=1 Tax=Heterostelium pallidum (strain ATCC 26659 / Pp 5 / PN500) TaxID=670386 RepID=D3AW33_HETP5|nr:hypothetical protein PPL_00300 [Heterostelium album PN500]EFA86506.1 hypothetical protein PPL_00300 [Heterostelium album PN500]|eukprot:XP_020438611.1 hypothetical protein PPL_00300 [Heterostelium album PN500]
MDCCSVSGSLEVIKYIQEQMDQQKTMPTPPVEPSIKWGLPSRICFDVAAGSGNLELVKYLLEKQNQLYSYPDAVLRAISLGHTEIVKYLRENTEVECSPDSHIEAAIASGNYETFLFLAETGDYMLYKETMDCAIRHSNEKVVEYLYYNHFESATVNEYTFENACLVGYMPVIRFLYESYTLSPDHPYIDALCKKPSLEVLEYLDSIEFNQGTTRDSFINVISHGRVEMVRWMLKNHREFNDESMLRDTVDNPVIFEILLADLEQRDDITLDHTHLMNHSIKCDAFGTTMLLSTRFQLPIRPLIETLLESSEISLREDMNYDDDEEGEISINDIEKEKELERERIRDEEYNNNDMLDEDNNNSNSSIVYSNNSLDYIDGSIFDKEIHVDDHKKIRLLNNEILELKIRLQQLEQSLKRNKLSDYQQLPLFALNASLLDDKKRDELEKYIFQYYKMYGAVTNNHKYHNRNMVYHYSQNFFVQRDGIPELATMKTSIPYNFEKIPSYTCDKQNLQENLENEKYAKILPYYHIILDYHIKKSDKKKFEGTCFNCSQGGHSLADCPFYKDFRRINRNRREFFDSKPVMNRYYVSEKGDTEQQLNNSSNNSVNSKNDNKQDKNEDYDPSSTATTTTATITKQTNVATDTVEDEEGVIDMDDSDNNNNDNNDNNESNSSSSGSKEKSVSTFDIIKKNTSSKSNVSDGTTQDKRIEENNDFIKLPDADDDEPYDINNYDSMYNGGGGGGGQQENILLNQQHQQKVAQSIQTFINAHQQRNNQYQQHQQQHQQQQYYQQYANYYAQIQQQQQQQQYYQKSPYYYPPPMYHQQPQQQQLPQYHNIYPYASGMDQYNGAYHQNNNQYQQQTSSSSTSDAVDMEVAEDGQLH